jgi:cupin 2 domain-containing protein
MNVQNLFDLPAGSGREVFDTLLQTEDLKLERIISTGQMSPPGQWYDQERDEWVLLVSGSAGLRIEGEPGARVLSPGDHLLIPAHCRHRVEWTSSDEPAVWLALHFSPAGKLR